MTPDELAADLERFRELQLRAHELESDIPPKKMKPARRRAPKEAKVQKPPEIVRRTRSKSLEAPKASFRRPSFVSRAAPVPKKEPEFKYKNRCGTFEQNLVASSSYSDMVAAIRKASKTQDINFGMSHGFLPKNTIYERRRFGTSYNVPGVDMAALMLSLDLGQFLQEAGPGRVASLDMV